MLTFCGEKFVPSSFFEQILGGDAFVSMERFREKVEAFQALALNLYGSFRYAYRRLRDASDIEQALAPLNPVDEKEFTQQQPFTAIEAIQVEYPRRPWIHLV